MHPIVCPVLGGRSPSILLPISYSRLRRPIAKRPISNSPQGVPYPIASASARGVLLPARGLLTAIPCTTDRTSAHTALAVVAPPLSLPAHPSPYLFPPVSAICLAIPPALDTPYHLASARSQTRYLSNRLYRYLHSSG